MKINKEDVLARIRESVFDESAKQYSRILENYLKTFLDQEINQYNINLFFEEYKPCRTNTSFFKNIFKWYGINNIRLPKTKSNKRNNTTELHYFDVKHIMGTMPFESGIYIKIYHETGLRLKELIDVERKNIDMFNNTLSGIGKRRKSFKVKISSNSMKILNQLGWLYKEYPFRRKNIKHTDKWIHTQFKKYAEQKGFPNTSIHQIRHSLGRYLRKEKGLDLEVVREILRHSSIVTTQIYARAKKEEADKVMEELLE